MKNKITNFGKFYSQLELPFSETENEFLKEIFKTLELEFGLKSASNQTLIDLGSGKGNVVIFVVLNYNIKAVGIEINQNLHKEAKVRIKSLKKEVNYKKKFMKKINIMLGDLFQQNLIEYDFIYIYSLPSMHKYLKHVFKTAQKGAIIISHKYKLKHFDSILREKYNLSHKSNKKEIFTFFYKKIR